MKRALQNLAGFVFFVGLMSVSLMQWNAQAMRDDKINQESIRHEPHQSNFRF
jgi:hypothetical protein